MGTPRNPGLFDCRGMPDEPEFNLLARDPSFRKFVEMWADERERAVRCGDRPQSDLMQVNEARGIAIEGERWRRDNLYAWRSEQPAAPVADVAERRAN